MEFKSKIEHVEKVFLNLPNDFLIKKQFCLWKYEQRINSSKLSKIPCFLKKNRIIKANIKDSKQWLTGFDALKIAMKYNNLGIGLIMINTPLFGIDLDDCLYEGKLLTWAQEIIDHFTDTYIEVSPSGKGLHILGYGKLNLIRNISPKNKRIEAYDGTSIRYLTLTGHLFKQSSKTFFYYEKENKNLKWLKNTFFNVDLNSTKQETFNREHLFNINYKNKHNIEQQILDIEQIIQRSKDAKLFRQYQSTNLINHKSNSEDDWHFCLLVLKYMPNANFELLQKFLLKYRNRIKIQREDYVKLTIEKVLKEAKKNKIIGISKQDQINKNTISSTKLITSTITKYDSIKHCNMFNLFTIKEELFLDQKQILIQRDNQNFIKIFTHQSLSGLDLDNYIGLLQMTNLDTNNNTYINSQATGDLLNTVKIKIDFSKLSSIIQKQDGGKFRRSILQTIRKMSNIYFEYKKIIDKEGNIIEGGSHLLSWYSHKDRSQNVKKIIVSINPFAWYIMKHSKYNYCLINTKERFKLDNIQQRLLYFHLCRKVIPGTHYFYEFSIEELCHDLWGYTSNKNTNKARKKRTRKLCQDLYKQQDKLTDFEIHLIKKSLTIQYMKIKRYRISFN